ncbi:ferrous iron transport protein B [Lachnotalea glycerini]|uniref:Ferrous iron transport protein B n=1 Tax=Lachnotalea glycerini TaxID=1763509 RepID=A0A318EUN9_9FIRM|nr:ferrous iron transport protein B [Lachnotalea glycerini]PXV93272.1 ferrous iron transport protein B [Lachnotalea glycerini]
MGLTKNSVGIRAVDSHLKIIKQTPSDKVVAIAGNPNVGKSTVFNNLTGMNQHTGNWPGKTVTNAQGYCSTKQNSYVLVDIPGTYSLMAHSAEEKIARNFICFGRADAIVVVCDATCLERNLNLVLQTLEISRNVIVCINLMDEARRKGIRIDLKELSKQLGVRVVGSIARKKHSLNQLMQELDVLMQKEQQTAPLQITYRPPIEEAISILQPVIEERFSGSINSRWLSLKLLDYDQSLMDEISAYTHKDIFTDSCILDALKQSKTVLDTNKITGKRLEDSTVASVVLKAEDIFKHTVFCEKKRYDDLDRKIDRVLTSKWTGYPVMLILLAIVFWLTIAGANYPSKLLSCVLFGIENKLTEIFYYFGAPMWLHGILIAGAYRVLAWVISVMLPPMAIFFPLFTLLEDSGYLPRIAYNLDKPFKHCCACGKQALTMCMGFGCNAAGIVGCRIIDSPREQLIAMLTNNFVPCNGRFPTLIAIISMFFLGASTGILPSLLLALYITMIIVLGVLMTFIVSYVLSKTVLKGVTSSFTLELPPYRRPQVLKVLVHSIFDRTIFVLGRAAVVAIPTGIFIWIMANTFISGTTILNHCAGFLDPFARWIGLDGVILMAFILGLPANEIVVPIIIMTYMAQGSMQEIESLTNIKQLLLANNWTWITAISTMLFSLMHWPCSTTLLTIKKESGSLKWTMVSFIVPTFIGILCCFLFANIAKMF